jgi:hypothetical protein
VSWCSEGSVPSHLGNEQSKKVLFWTCSPVTQPHVLEDLNLQQNRCGNLKPMLHCLAAHCVRSNVLPASNEDLLNLICSCRQGVGKYLPADIDAALCTHIVYGFAVLNGDQLIIKPHDTWADLDNSMYLKQSAIIDHQRV